MRRDAVNQPSLPQFASEVKEAETPAAANRATDWPGLTRAGAAHRGQSEVNHPFTDLPLRKLEIYA